MPQSEWFFRVWNPRKLILNNVRHLCRNNHTAQQYRNILFQIFKSKDLNIIFLVVLPYIKATKLEMWGSEFILTSNPRRTAMWKDSNWSGMTDKIPCRQSTVLGTSRVRKACPLTSSSPSLQIIMGRPYKRIRQPQKMFKNRKMLNQGLENLAS